MPRPRTTFVSFRPGSGSARRVVPAQTDQSITTSFLPGLCRVGGGGVIETI